MVLAMFTGKTTTQLQRRIEAHKTEKVKLKEIINQAVEDRSATVKSLQEEMVHLHIMRESF